jgi:hypothetical protein
VNFLMHRRLAADALGSDVAGVGGMLPDLWRIADRRVRASDIVERSDRGRLADLMDGIAHHLSADRRFHKAEVFTRGEALVGEVMKTLAAPRARLFAHITWELCLDGELVRRDGIDQVLDATRRGFSRGDAAMTEAAEAHHFARVPREAAEREVFEHKMRRIVHGLVHGPWIASYRSGRGVAERVSGVRVSLGLPPFDFDDRLRLAEGLDALAGDAASAVDEIFADRAYFQATRRAANRSARCS